MIAERIEKAIEKNRVNGENAISTLIAEAKIAQDFIAPIGESGRKQPSEKHTVEFLSNGHVKMAFNLNNEMREYTIGDLAIAQLGEKLGVPTEYLRRLSAGDEWQRNLVARILNDHTGWTPRKRFLIRSVGDEVRGVLSDNYRRLNGMAIITGYLSQAQAEGGILSNGFISPTRISIETLYPAPVDVHTTKNGIVTMAFGARLSTSDYGDGALDLRTFMMQGVCLNGAVRESIMRQVHLGSKLPDNLQLSQRTYDYDTKTTVSALRDVTKKIFSVDEIKRRIVEIQAASATDEDIEVELNNLTRTGQIQKQEADGVKTIFMRNSQDDGVGGESTLWKLVQGISAEARTKDGKRERELQEVAGNLMSRAK